MHVSKKKKNFCVILGWAISEKCGMGGENANGIGPQLLVFPQTQTTPTFFKEHLLAEVSDKTDTCRHKFVANLKCELASAEFSWGVSSDSSKGSNYYPRKFRMGNLNNAKRVLAVGDEDVSGLILGISGDYLVAEEDCVVTRIVCKLKIRLS